MTRQLDELRVSVYESGDTRAHVFDRELEGLFDVSYHRYHYKSKLFDEGRIRLFVEDREGRLVGFGTVKQEGKFAVLANLLVDPEARGKGVGKLLEENRMKIVESAGLCPYSSCVTVGDGSQKLKLRYGLVPVNYKLGNRRGVFSPSDVSSAVVFLGRAPDWRPIKSDRLELDRPNDRTRLIAFHQDYLDGAIVDLAGIRTGYVDLVVHPQMTVPENFTFQGIELVLESGAWGELWQYNNEARELGLHGSLDLAISLEAVEVSARSLVESDVALKERSDAA